MRPPLTAIAAQPNLKNRRSLEGWDQPLERKVLTTEDHSKAAE